MRRNGAVAGFMIVVLLAGCSGSGSAAEADARRRADNAGFAMAKAPRSAVAVERARRVVGDAGVARIELMAADGDGIDGHVVLRISSRTEPAGFNQGGEFTGCFRYDFSDGSGGTRASDVRCPDGPPQALPSPPVEPRLPPDAEDSLRRALLTLDPDGEVRRVFAGTGAAVQILRSSDGVGAAVSAGASGCLHGRRTGTGTVETWRVPPDQARPGELGCTAENAVEGLGKPSD